MIRVKILDNSNVVLVCLRYLRSVVPTRVCFLLVHYVLQSRIVSITVVTGVINTVVETLKSDPGTCDLIWVNNCLLRLW